MIYTSLKTDLKANGIPARNSIPNRNSDDFRINGEIAAYQNEVQLIFSVFKNEFLAVIGSALRILFTYSAEIGFHLRIR